MRLLRGRKGRYHFPTALADFYLLDESLDRRLGDRTAEIHGPVRLPRRPAICRKGLLPPGVVRVGREPVEPNPDGRAIQAVVCVERSNPVLESAHDGHIDLVGSPGIQPPDGPLPASGVKRPQCDGAVWTLRQVQQIVLNVSEAPSTGRVDISPWNSTHSVQPTSLSRRRRCVTRQSPTANAKSVGASFSIPSSKISLLISSK